jgi:hypothetical protein
MKTFVEFKIFSPLSILDTVMSVGCPLLCLDVKNIVLRNIKQEILP